MYSTTRWMLLAAASVPALFFLLFGFGSIVGTEERLVEEAYRQPMDTSTAAPGRNFTYATLLLTDSFLPGVLVLGHSLDASGSVYPKTAVVTRLVTSHTRNILHNAGWLLHEVEMIKNPHSHEAHFQERLLWVFTKLNIFRLPFDKVVYMDADMLVSANLDEVFECGWFCAAMRGNHFNSGLMVLTPSKELFDEMYARHLTTPSYNAGEQGFTNSFFPHILHMPLYSPYSDPALVRHPSPRNGTRLDPTYNGDAALFYVHGSEWRYGEPKVIHYTMLYFKPWNWFEYPLFHLNWKWLPMLPLAREPASVTLVRMANPLLFLALAAWAGRVVIEGTLDNKGNQLVASWAGVVGAYTSLYAFALLVLNLGLIALAVVVGLAVTPGIPAAHPVASAAIFVEWLGVLVLLALWGQCNVHWFLGKIVRDPSAPPPSALYPKFRGKLTAVAVLLGMFVADMLLLSSGAAKIGRMVVVVLPACYLVCLLVYRLPMVCFRMGQYGPAYRNVEEDDMELA